MAEQDPLKFVVMGAGNIGHRHIQILHNLAGAELAAVIEPDFNQRSRLAETCAGRLFPSFSDFASSGIAADVLSVCTPNYLHSRHALTGLSAGMHVVCEKPLALQLGKGKAVLERSAQTGKMVFCMQQLVLGAALQWVKQLLKNQQLGVVRQVRVFTRWNRDESYYLPGSWRGGIGTDGGPLFTQFSHFIHALFWLFGDLEITGARFENRRRPLITEFEDSGQVDFRFLQGGQGQLQYTTAAPKHKVGSEILVMGDKGSLGIGGQYLQEITRCDIPGVVVPVMEALVPVALQEKFFQGVISQINQRDYADTNALEGLKVVELIENIYGHRRTSLNAAFSTAGNRL